MKRSYRSRTNRGNPVKHVVFTMFVVALLVSPLTGDQRHELLDRSGKGLADGSGKGLAAVPGFPYAPPDSDLSALLADGPGLEGTFSPRTLGGYGRASSMNRDRDFITSLGRISAGEFPSGVTTGPAAGESRAGGADGASPSSSSPSTDATLAATGVASLVPPAFVPGPGILVPGLPPAGPGIIPEPAPSPTPEPGTILLLGSALAGLAALARRRRRR